MKNLAAARIEARQKKLATQATQAHSEKRRHVTAFLRLQQPKAHF